MATSPALPAEVRNVICNRLHSDTAINFEPRSNSHTSSNTSRLTHQDTASCHSPHNPSSSAEIARPLTGLYATTHLRDFGFEESHIQQASDRRSEATHSADVEFPSSEALGSPLAQLDMFCPTEYAHADPQDLPDAARFVREDSGFFDMDEEDLGLGREVVYTEDLAAGTLDDEELDGGDDVYDEEMEDIDDIDGILGNLEELDMRRVNERVVCYLTNFAPQLLGKWLEEAA